MAPRIRPAQHLGGDAPCRVLEICAAAKNRRREARLFRAERQQFFARPEKGKLNEAAWNADKKLLEREHRALRVAIAKLLRTSRGSKFVAQLYGIAFHDIYHAGQIRLPPPPDGALTRISVLAGTGQERACREHPERVEWQRSPLRPRQDTPRCSLEQFRRWPAPESRPRGTLRQAAQDLAARQMSLSDGVENTGPKKR